jgi:hypothetical protein
MGNNHSNWYNDKKRKVLILTIDIDYLNRKNYL